MCRAGGRRARDKGGWAGPVADGALSVAEIEEAARLFAACLHETGLAAAPAAA